MTTIEGERFAGYLLGRRLGEGGMGEVYLARDSAGRQVALKMLTSLREEAVARFREELEVGLRLRHRNLIRTLAGGEEEGIPYVVLELLRGRTLHEMVGSGSALAPGAVLEVARQLAAALDYLHGQGVVHRDLKPANVFLTEDGVIKLLDLGVVRPEGRPTRTRTGAAVGSLLFMAPEQAGGERATAASDLFAFGLVLHLLLTGRHAHHDRASTEIGEYLLRLFSGQLGAWHAERAGGAMDRFFRRALARREEDRFSSGASLFRAFEGALAAEELLPEVPGPGAPASLVSLAEQVQAASLTDTGAALVAAGDSDPISSPRRRRPAWLAVIGLAAALLAGGLWVGLPGAGGDAHRGARPDHVAALRELLSRVDLVAAVLSGREGGTGTGRVERELRHVGLRSFLDSRGPGLIEGVRDLLAGGGLDGATLEGLHQVWLADAYLRARAGTPLPGEVGPRLGGLLGTVEMYRAKPPAAPGRVVFPDGANRFLVVEDPAAALKGVRVVSEILFRRLPAVNVRLPRGVAPPIAEVHMSSGVRFQRSYFGLLRVGAHGPFLVADLPAPGAPYHEELLHENLDKVRRIFRLRLPDELQADREHVVRLTIYPWRRPSGEVHATLSIHALGLMRGSFP